MSYQLTFTSSIPTVSSFFDAEYILIAEPSAEAREMIMAEKYLFQQDYQQDGALSIKPFIKVACFNAREEMEDTIIRWMHRIISMQESFEVMLNNYSGFPPHTIYARVQFTEPFKKLATQFSAIDHYLLGNGCKPLNFSKHPHVTIARKLHERVYEKAMLDYSQRSFFASFYVNELALLKRRSENEAFKQVYKFGLTPVQHPLYD